MSNQLMAGKRGLIMGLANDKSIAWGIAKALADAGAEMAFSYMGDAFRKRVEPLAEQLGVTRLYDCDVGDEASIDAMFQGLERDWGKIDFLVHAIGFSDKSELRGRYVDTSRANFAMTMDISVYSFTAVAARAEKLEQSSAGDIAPPAWRLNLQAALSETGPIHWTDLVAGPQHWDGTGWGDVIVARRDIGTSYHIAVTTDDALQGITDIVRGQDLFHSTHIHRVLQILLDLPEPRYLHHPLLMGDDGRRLAKSHASRPLREYRQEGTSARDLIDGFPEFCPPDLAVND